MPEDLRRKSVRRGMFLVSDPVPPGYTVKRKPLAPEYQHFDEAARLADELKTFEEKQAAQIGELARRFIALRAQLDEINSKRGRKK